MRKRILIIIGGLVVAGVLMVAGAIAGGSLVAALSHDRPRAGILSFLENSRLGPVLAGRQETDGTGIVVATVEEDGPAAVAGIVRGDILLELDGQPVDSRSGLIQALSSYAPGDTVEATIRHGDEERTVSITLGDRDGQVYIGITLCVAACSLGDGARVSMPASDLGAVVVSVTPGSPAEEAGLQENDVITTVDGQAPSLEDNLADMISEHAPGDKVTLEVTRPGTGDAEETQTLTLDATLGEHPDDATKAYLGIEYQLRPRGVMTDGSGRFGWLPEGSLPHLDPNAPPLDGPLSGAMTGIVVREVAQGSPAEDAGLQVGDSITAIDGSEVTTVEDLLNALGGLKPGDQVTLTVQSAGEDQQHDVEVMLGSHPDDASRAYLGVVLANSLNLRRFGDGNGLDRFFGRPGRPGAGGTEDL
jgi:S1-C subfamily serine protease